MFDLQKCIAGEPVEDVATSRKFHFIAYNESLMYPLIMSKDGLAYSFTKEGKSSHKGTYILQLVKPIRKVDLSKLPVDTIFNTPDGLAHFCRDNQDGTISTYSRGRSSLTNEGYMLYTWDIAHVNLYGQQPWIPETGKFYLPEGLGYEVLKNNCDTIIALRLTGRFFDNWTL